MSDDPDGLTAEERADSDTRSAMPAGRVLVDARDARGVLRYGSAWPFFAAYLLLQGIRLGPPDLAGPGRPIAEPGPRPRPDPAADYRAARGYATGASRRSLLPTTVILYRADHRRVLPRVGAGLLPWTTRRRAVVRLSWWHDEDRRMVTNHRMNELLQRECRRGGLVVSTRSRGRWSRNPAGVRRTRRHTPARSRSVQLR